MKKDDARYVLATIENEGFNYCFVHYSNFEDIKDEEFHVLRRNYLKAIDDMNDYLNKSKEGNDL